MIPKSQRYNVSAIYHFIKYRARRLEILVDNQIIKDEYTTVVAANVRYYGGGYKVGTNSFLNDGILDIYLVKGMNKIKMASSILGMKDGKHEKIQELNKIFTDKLIVKIDDVFERNIDGEVLESNLFDIKLVKNGMVLYNDPVLVKKIILR